MPYVRAFALSAIFGVAVLSVLALYGDLPRLAQTARAFPAALLVPVLLLTSTNYLLRWVKWRYYLRLVDAAEVTRTDSVLVFLSGFAMGLTPGKVGEIIKPYLLRERYGIPISRTTPIPFAERLSDGIAMLLLGSAGAVVYGTGAAAFAAIVVLAIAALVVVRSARLRTLLLGIAVRLPVLGPRADALHELFLSAAALVAWRPLAFAVALGVLSWGCEAVAFFLVLAGLGQPLTPTLLLQATFALASAGLFGSASLLPGGLGVAEASLTGYLQLGVGLARPDAVYATLVIRLCTLWFGIALGTLALLAAVGRRAAIEVGETAVETLPSA